MNKFFINTDKVKVPIDKARDIFIGDTVLAGYLLIFGFIPVSVMKDKFNPDNRIFYFQNDEDTINAITDIIVKYNKQ